MPPAGVPGSPAGGPAGGPSPSALLSSWSSVQPPSRCLSGSARKHPGPSPKLLDTQTFPPPGPGRDSHGLRPAAGCPLGEAGGRLHLFRPLSQAPQKPAAAPSSPPAAWGAPKHLQGRGEGAVARPPCWPVGRLCLVPPQVPPRPPPHCTFSSRGCAQASARCERRCAECLVGGRAQWDPARATEDRRTGHIQGDLRGVGPGRGLQHGLGRLRPTCPCGPPPPRVPPWPLATPPNSP